MTRRLQPLIAALILGGCTAPAPTPRVVTLFECPGLGDVVVRHGDDDAIVTMAGRDMVLPRAAAASGVRYQKGNDQFWEHRGEAFVDLDGRHYHGCRHNPARTPA